MATESWIIDSTAEDPANVQVDLLAYPFAVTQVNTPTPPLEPRWAQPADADGDRLVASRYLNREITMTLEIVPTDPTAAARAATAQAALARLADKVAKINREDGTLRRTLPTGDVLTFDLLTADQLDPPWDIDWDVANVLKLELKFTAKPFARGVEISGTVDTFATNTFADYLVGGPGSSVSGGTIVVSSTNTKTWLHQARKFIDGTITLRINTGASVTTWSHQIIAKAVDTTNYLCAQITNAGAISFVKTVAGTPTTLGTPLAGANLAPSTSYWMRLVPNSNVLTAELWTTDPALGGSPARTTSYTLTAGDITTYGEGVSGYAGFRLGPGGTDWTYDDFSALWMVQEKTLPVLTLTVPGADGDAPALGRLVITDLQGADQAWAVWGLQSRSYDPASTAAMYFTAASRTSFSGPLSSSDFKAILSTQATGGGAHLTHVGSYRVFTLIGRGTAAGVLSLAFDWSVGDFVNNSRNPQVTYPVGDSSSATRIFDLGIVTVPPDPGAQRWEGRIVAKSSVVGDVAPTPSALWLVPIDEGSGELTATSTLPSTTVYSALDDFAQTTGNLTGEALPIGGSWVGAGTSSTDFTTTTGGHQASRAATGDASANIASGRLLTASTPTAMTNTVAQCFVTAQAPSSGGVLTGVIARYASSSAFIAGYLSLSAIGTADLVITKRVGGVDTVLVSASLGSFGSVAFATLTLRITSAGLVTLTSVAGGPLNGRVATFDSSIATGGALASGGVGVLDRNTGNAPPRTYQAFSAYPYIYDASVFAGRSAEINAVATLRQDSSGTVWGSAGYAGDRMVIPVAGPEGRVVRSLVKAARVMPSTGPDTGPDDIGERLYITPRYLSVS